MLRLLDDLAYGDGSHRAGAAEADAFVDEYLLPKVVDSAQNGWPDWAVLWRDRVWIIELKTEAGSHREDQLPYYLLLATAAHPGCRVDLTYMTGPLSKSPPEVSEGNARRPRPELDARVRPDVRTTGFHLCSVSSAAVDSGTTRSAGTAL